MSSSAAKPSNQTKKSMFGGSTRPQGGVTKSRRGGPPLSVASRSRVGQSTYGAGSRTVLSSASRRHAPTALDKMKPETKPPIQVYDDDGLDVTPLPLLHLDPNVVRQKQSNILAESSAGTPTDLMSTASIYQTGTTNQSTFGGPFTRSVFSQSQSERSTTSMAGADDLEHHENVGSTAEITRVIREEPKEVLQESDLDKEVEINLSETDTIWILDLPGICVNLDSDEAELIKAQNTRYAELCKDNVGNDRYVERGMNTFNNAPKLKYVQTNKISHNDVGISASTWDMYDTYKMIQDAENKVGVLEEVDEGDVLLKPPGSESSVPAGEKSDDGKDGDVKVDVEKEATTMSKAMENVSSAVSSDAFMAFSKEGIVAKVEETDEEKNKKLLESDEFRLHLVNLERALNLNNFQPKQALYRGLQLVEDIDKAVPVVEESDKDLKKRKKTTSSVAAAIMVPHEVGPAVDRLWTYQCPITKGRNVSCMTWNRSNPDLLAVGYGQFDYNKQKGGLVCCWSLKNPKYPERIYTTASGVTSMDFSGAHANLLAVGLHNGTVAIFNVRNLANEAVLDSLRDLRHVMEEDHTGNTESTGKHTGPVWQLKWIEKERGSGDERSEVLVSVSTDGRVTQWSIRKGFESYDLMKLKRIARKTNMGKTKKPEALISKNAGGLCFDFNAKDSNIYLAGTEEGHIHRCSCSYNEQYLDSYHGHTGPVYKLSWSPFTSDVFLSCSGDWTVRLWHQDRTTPVLNFHSSTKAVPDMCWSPRSSTVFACVNEGAVEVWDLSSSVLDPVVINPTLDAGVKFSSVIFAQNSECLLVGDSEGGVTVFELQNMPDAPKPKHQVEVLQRIMKASMASALSQ